MASGREWILQEFDSMRRERDLALRQLSQAQEVIDLLEADIASLKCWATLKYAGIIEKTREQAGASMDEQGQQVKHDVQASRNEGTAWVHELWLCGLEENAILKTAEMVWTEKIPNPEEAIVIADDLLSYDLLLKDSLRCKLFIAAVLASAGSLDQACMICTDCIRDCGQQPRFQDLVGLALYIRGRVYCAMKLHKDAHWDFSRAVFTPHYHEKIKKWQGLAENWYLELLQGEVGDHSDKNLETAKWLESTSRQRPESINSKNTDSMALKTKESAESIRASSPEPTSPASEMEVMEAFSETASDDFDILSGADATSPEDGELKSSEQFVYFSTMRFST